MKVHRRGSRGIIIVMVLLVLAALVALASGMVIAGSGNLNGSFESVESEKALWAAEAGVAEGFIRLSADNSWTGMTSAVGSTDSTFQVTTFREPQVTPRGVAVPPGTIYLHSRGQTRTGKTREAGLLVKTGFGAMSYAILTKEALTVNNGTIEVRDPITDLVLPGAADLGAVNGDITLDALTNVTGNADVSDSYSVSGLDRLIGGIQRTISPPTFPDVVLPPGPNPETQPPAVYSGGVHSIPPGFYDKIEIDNGAEVTFSPGNYVVKNLIVKNNSKLIFNDTTPCNIFATGGVLMEQYNIVNTSRVPKNFRILADEPGNPPVDVKLGSEGYYVIYAPASTVLVDDQCTIYGAVVARDMTVTKSKIYYDPNSADALDMGGGMTAAGLQKVSHQFF